MTDNENIAKAVETLADAVNHMDTNEVVDELLDAFFRQHRTLQAMLAKAVVKAAVKIPSLPNNCFDLRNESVKNFSKWLKEQLETSHSNSDYPDCFPLI